jgi:hypothetical protein
MKVVVGKSFVVGGFKLWLSHYPATLSRRSAPDELCHQSAFALSYRELFAEIFRSSRTTVLMVAVFTGLSVAYSLDSA